MSACHLHVDPSHLMQAGYLQQIPIYEHFNEAAKKTPPRTVLQRLSLHRMQALVVGIARIDM